MKFSLPWLKTHLATDADAKTVGDTLTAIGLELEGIDARGADLAAFSVAHVVGVRQHPNADRLNLCDVVTKDGRFEVVCGAPNVRLGMKAIYAPEGSTIPANGMVLKKTKIRGVESHGMLCSSRELKVGDDHDGIIDLGDAPEIGTPAAAVLGLEGPVIDIAITPNRADCFGLHGIARDLAAAGLGQLIEPNLEPVPATVDDRIETRFAFAETERDPCPIFVTRVIKGVKNGPSPAWLQERLKGAGLRPISALVDITNFATLGMGRPLHVFDRAKLQGDFTLKLAEGGETFKALDGKDYTLSAGMTAICDASGVVSLAGVMGGETTGCDMETTDVVVEIALFDPIRTAMTGRTLDIVSDARQRFERGLDPALVLPGAELATRLILELCGGEPGPVTVTGSVPDHRREIAFDRREVRRLVGIDVDDGEVERSLTALGCNVVSEGDGRYRVTTPTWRHDLARPADLVEEVARLGGLDRVPATSLPMERAARGPILTATQQRRGRVRRMLAARGLNEAATFAFVPAADAELFGGVKARLANPISADLDAMRPSILPALTAAVGRNQARALADVALFEVGDVYTGSEPSEQESTAAGVRAGAALPRHWGDAERSVDALDAKADALAALETAGVRTEALRIDRDTSGHYHPGRSGRLMLGPKNCLAEFGELHPKIVDHFDLTGRPVAFEVFLDRLPKAKPAKTKARPPLQASPYQPVERDFAFLVAAEVPAGDLLQAVRAAEPDLIREVTLFDVYSGKGVPEGQVSMAVSVRLQALDRTLEDAEIDAVAQNITASAAKACGAALRQ